MMRRIEIAAAALLLSVALGGPAAAEEAAESTEVDGATAGEETATPAGPTVEPTETDSPAVELTDEERREQARQHFQRGMGLVGERRWDAALEEFNQSLGLYPTQSALFNSGVCLGLLGRPVDAVSVLERHLAEYGDTITDAERNATERALRSNRDHVGHIEVMADGVGEARVLLDGEPVGTVPLAPVPVNPGRHQVTVEAVDSYALSRWVNVDPGDSMAVVLAMERRQTAEGSVLSSSVTSSELAHDTGRGLRTAGWTALTMSILNLGAATALMLWNNQRYADWETEQQEIRDIYLSAAAARDADPDELALRADDNNRVGDRIDNTVIVSWAAMATGIAAGILAVPLLIVGYLRREDPEAQQAGRLRPGVAVGPGGVGFSLAMTWGQP